MSATADVPTATRRGSSSPRRSDSRGSTLLREHFDVDTGFDWSREQLASGSATTTGS